MFDFLGNNVENICFIVVIYNIRIGNENIVINRVWSLNNLLYEKKIVNVFYNFLL